MNPHHPSGFVVPGALLLAAVSALGLVAACHSTALPPAAAQAAVPAPAVAAVAASQAPVDFATEHPFEEMFHVNSPEDAEPQN